MSVTRYVLSEAAEADVSDIDDYTLRRHGQSQADTYLQGLHESLRNLARLPQSGRARHEIRKGLRSQVYESHVIFYRVMSDHIRIVRVLHGSRDFPRFLAE